MLSFLRRHISNTNPLRLVYHRALAMLAAFWYRFPASELKVIAVTGTKGKTTTTNLIASVLMEMGKKVGLTSTIFFQIGRKKWPNLTKQTTLGRFELQRLLREMVEAGCEYAVIEASSHAVTQSRLWGVNIDVAVMTNLEPEHIEYHGTFENYRNAKATIFRELARQTRKPGMSKVAVLNRDMKEFEFFDQFSADRKISYGLKKGATMMAEDIEYQSNGLKFTLKIPNREETIFMNLPGRFNLYNALATAAVAMTLGISLKKIKKALGRIKVVPGRLEVIEEGQEFTTVVDYAHTADSLEQLCQVFRDLTKGRIILVFGATGGGRDKDKRPVMGKVADKYADVVIVTNDDPYDEDQLEIIDQIGKGIKRAEGKDFWKIIDRKEAIRLALRLAEPEDTVLIAGKGAEEFMVLKDNQRVPHDDRKVARQILREELEVDLD